MIALLAAVPEESLLLRQALKNREQRSLNGINVLTGKMSREDICLAHSGIGKAAAAATAVSLLSSCRPQALWLLGCGGAYPGSGLGVGDLALASVEIFGDEGVATPTGFRDFAEMKLPMRKEQEIFYNRWPTDRKLHDWARPHLAKHAATEGVALRSGAFVTVSTCTGLSTLASAIEKRTEGICENMEGAAVALACQQLATPMLEVRGISNMVEDRDTRRWDLPAGMAAAQKAILTLLQAWPGYQP